MVKVSEARGADALEAVGLKREVGVKLIFPPAAGPKLFGGFGVSTLVQGKLESF